MLFYTFKYQINQLLIKSSLLIHHVLVTFVALNLYNQQATQVYLELPNYYNLASMLCFIISISPQSLDFRENYFMDEFVALIAKQLIALGSNA